VTRISRSEFADQLLLLGDIGDVGASRRDVSARQAVDDARGKQHEEGASHRQHDKAHHRAEQAEDEDGDYLRRVEVPQPPEVHHHDDADERFQDEDELALGDEVRLAGLVDELRDLLHRAMHGHPLDLLVDDQAEHQPGQANQQAAQQQAVTRDTPEKGRAPEVGEHQTGFAAATSLGGGGQGRSNRKDDVE